MAPDALQYATLPTETSIRLLELHPTHSAKQTYKLITVDLLDARRPGFHCLSYTCGDPFPPWENATSTRQKFAWNKKRPIFIQDRSNTRSGSVRITRNLRCFLQELQKRKQKAISHLWVDAICINQRDVNERTAQVQMMAKIYSSCDKVVIWLGPKHDDIAAIAHRLEEFGRCTESQWDTFTEGWGQKGLAYHSPRTLQCAYHNLNITPLKGDEFEAYAQFIRRGWFARTWTVQEFALPKVRTFWCGSYTLSLDGLSRMNWLAGEWLLTNEDSTNATTWLNGYQQAYNLNTALIWVGNLVPDMMKNRGLWGRPHLRGKLCSDPRDHLFAGLGLKDPEDQGPDVDVDYTQSIETAFLDTALKMGIEHCVQSCLNDPAHQSSRHLPSWVPDYSAPYRPYPWSGKGGGGGQYQAGGAQTTDDQVTAHNPTIVSLSGVVIDSIDEPSCTLKGFLEGTGIVHALHLLNKLDHRSNEDLIEVFWRTLIADLRGNRPGPPDKEIWGPSFRAFLLCYLSKWISHVGVGSPKALSALKTLVTLRVKTNSQCLPTCREVVHWSRKHKAGLSTATKAEIADLMRPFGFSARAMFTADRRFYTTTAGRLGVGPQSLARGQRICALRGWSYPVILEDCGQIPNRYRVIGVTYVRGIMHGEAVGGGDSFARLEIA